QATGSRSVATGPEPGFGLAGELGEALDPLGRGAERRERAAVRVADLAVDLEALIAVICVQVAPPVVGLQVVLDSLARGRGLVRVLLWVDAVHDEVRHQGGQNLAHLSSLRWGRSRVLQDTDGRRRGPEGVGLRRLPPRGRQGAP